MRILRPDAASLHAGALSLDPVARGGQDRAALWSPSPATFPCPTSARRAGNFGPAANYSKTGRCSNRAGHPDVSRWPGNDRHPDPPPAVRANRLDAPPQPDPAGGDREGRRGAARRRTSRNTTRSQPSERLFGGGDKRVVKGQREPSASSQRKRDARHRGRVGLLAKVLRWPRFLMGLEPQPRRCPPSITSDRKHRHRGSPTRCLDPDGVRRTRSTTLNPWNDRGPARSIPRSEEDLSASASPTPSGANPHAGTCSTCENCPAPSADRKCRGNLSRAAEAARSAIARRLWGGARIRGWPRNRVLGARRVCSRRSPTCLMEIQRNEKTTLPVHCQASNDPCRYVRSILSDRVMVNVSRPRGRDRRDQPGLQPALSPLYTEALLSAVPIADTKRGAEKSTSFLEGDIPSGDEPACRVVRFQIAAGPLEMPRCRATSCETEVAGRWSRWPKGHQIKCHLSRDILERMEPVITNRRGANSAAPSAGQGTSCPSCRGVDLETRSRGSRRDL